FLIPFTTTIPKSERDTELPAKLRAERGGILAWALEGCVRWQEIGLSPPPSVRAATEDYMTDEDTLAIWIAEACECDGTAFAATAELHASYQAWAERAGERFLGIKRFAQALEDRGYVRDRTNRVRGFTGLRLKSAQALFGAVK